MLVETLIFSVIAFALFVYIFYRLIKENDTKICNNTCNRGTSE